MESQNLKGFRTGYRVVLRECDTHANFIYPTRKHALELLKRHIGFRSDSLLQALLIAQGARLHHYTRLMIDRTEELTPKEVLFVTASKC